MITDTHYDIALRDSADPVAPGADLTYKLTFGYREEALNLANATLTFPVPAGTSFVSATGGGSLIGGLPGCSCLRGGYPRLLVGRRFLPGLILGAPLFQYRQFDLAGLDLHAVDQ